MEDPWFRPDLYRGTDGYYDRFRVPYPQLLIDDLAGRAAADGNGRLLDPACGPGLISFARRGRFSEIWAVDQEPDMITAARQKATAAGIDSIQFLVSAAEDLVGNHGPVADPSAGSCRYDEAREQRSDLAILRDSGFQFTAPTGSPPHGNGCPRTFSVMMAASLGVRTWASEKGPAGVFRRGLGVRAGGVVVSLT